MMHNGVLMEIELDQIAPPYTDELARRYFKEMMLGIEYCKLIYSKKGVVTQWDSNRSTCK